jgi:hypothetical protein
MAMMAVLRIVAVMVGTATTIGALAIVDAWTSSCGMLAAVDLMAISQLVAVASAHARERWGPR